MCNSMFEKFFIKTKTCWGPMMGLGLWVLTVGIGCGSNKAAEELELAKKKAAAATKPVLVEVGQVRRGMIEALLERSSALEAEAQVQVLARTQNPAIELVVEEGGYQSSS